MVFLFKHLFIMIEVIPVKHPLTDTLKKERPFSLAILSFGHCNYNNLKPKGDIYSSSESVSFPKVRLQVNRTGTFTFQVFNDEVLYILSLCLYTLFSVEFIVFNFHNFFHYKLQDFSVIFEH